ncbi:hypothetical protein JCGZ_19009 [Jatropha curcas]|uniref:GRAS40 protein n=2 Tax=Jatropha curcas TaxID=180498 RepID=A0A067K7Y3_JATCU|nr:GRAS40 protein [Jatropha curcas]AMR43786.1 GRAS42 protein [Jatropha curcas]KDP27929.1 hypothetical protein JCGZ_19009 [Jatropha curcas]
MLSFDYDFGTARDGLTSSSKSSGGIDYGLYQMDSSLDEGFLFSKYQQQEQVLQPSFGYKDFDDQRLDVLSPLLQTYLEEIANPDEIPRGIKDDSEPKKTSQHYFSLASLELLKKYGNNGRLNGGRIIDPSSDALYTKHARSELSTEEIIRIAGARFIQSCCQTTDVASMLNNPFSLSFSDLSSEVAKNVELVEFLLASAEKVGNQQYERATRLLNYCDISSSNTGNPVQRVVYYFSEALRERIDVGAGRISSKGFKKSQSFNLNQQMTILSSASFACHQRIPFFQVASFTAIQAIVENMAGEKRIHVIDLEIRKGVQWSVLMQALSSRHDCPIELLKISAIGTTSKQLIDDTGKTLASFAESMNIPFSFKAVMISDMLDLKEDLLELDTEEAIAIYSEYSLNNFIFAPNRLDSVMRVLRNISPQIMVVMEVEANNNSPSFVNRFIEALFFYSAYFDCFDACMDRDDPNRMITEMIFFHQGIRNIVANEGEERRVRHVKIDTWRSFFARFGIIEAQISTSSMYQATLMLKKFDCGSSCTLDMNNKSLLIGWKGTPIHSLSVWNFN